MSDTGRTTRVLGVDGCPGGQWVGALVSADGSGVDWKVFADARSVMSADADAVGIDIPVGLPSASWRDCDTAAKTALGPRHTSVFMTPLRAALEAETYHDACARSRAVLGQAITPFAWALRRRIRDVDAAMTPEQQSRVVEVHPEVSFTHLAGTPLPSKRSATGVGARLAALDRWLPVPVDTLCGAPRPARADDALDALAAAWSADRWLRREAHVLPGGDPPLDEHGLRMEIVA